MAELPNPPTPTLDAIYNAYEASQGDGFRDHLGASLIGKACARGAAKRAPSLPWPTSWLGSAGRCCAATRTSMSPRRSDQRQSSRSLRRPEAQQRQVRPVEVVQEGASPSS